MDIWEELNQCFLSVSVYQTLRFALISSFKISSLVQLALIENLIDGLSYTNFMDEEKGSMRD